MKRPIYSCDTSFPTPGGGFQGGFTASTCHGGDTLALVAITQLMPPQAQGGGPGESFCTLSVRWGLHPFHSLASIPCW